MKFLYLSLIIILSSCSTINRSRFIGDFRDENGVVYNIWKTEKYNRKTKELISVEIDTLVSSPTFTSTTVIRK